MTVDKDKPFMEDNGGEEEVLVWAEVRILVSGSMSPKEIEQELKKIQVEHPFFMADYEFLKFDGVESPNK